MPRIPAFHAGFAIPLEVLREEFDRLWTSLTTAPPAQGWGGRQAVTFPCVNVHERDDAIIIEAELPGLDGGDIAISVTGNELSLEGTRTVPREPAVNEKCTRHRRERPSGSFKRRIQLPVAVAADRVEARLADGVLKVTCPKAPECQPRRVDVQSA